MISLALRAARPHCVAQITGDCDCDGGYRADPEGEGVRRCDCFPQRRAVSLVNAAGIPWSMAQAPRLPPPPSPDGDSWQTARVQMTRMISGARAGILTLAGSPGTGKSSLLTLGLLEAAVAGRTVRYLNVRDAISEIRGDDSGPAAYSAALRRLREFELLALDEVGGQRTPFARDLVAAVLCGRYDDGRPTMVATNYTREDVEATLGPSVADRMFADVLYFSRSSHR